MTTEAPPKELKCWRCERKLAEEVTPPYRIVCTRCKAVNRAVK